MAGVACDKSVTISSASPQLINFLYHQLDCVFERSHHHEVLSSIEERAQSLGLADNQQLKPFLRSLKILTITAADNCSQLSFREDADPRESKAVRAVLKNEDTFSLYPIEVRKQYLVGELFKKMDQDQPGKFDWKFAEEVFNRNCSLTRLEQSEEIVRFDKSVINEAHQKLLQNDKQESIMNWKDLFSAHEIPEILNNLIEKYQPVWVHRGVGLFDRPLNSTISPDSSILTERVTTEIIKQKHDISS